MRLLARMAVIAAVAAAPVRSTLQSTTVPGQADPQSFRATTELVAVRTSVLRNGVPVPGLTAKDFVLTDNREERPVEAILLGTVPLDLVVVADSGGHSSFSHDGFSQQLQEIRPLVRADDTVRTTTGGLDELARAMVETVPSGRQRAILFVGVPGILGTSVLRYDTVLSVAQRTSARLDMALADWDISNNGIVGTRTRQRVYDTVETGPKDPGADAALNLANARDPDNWAARHMEAARRGSLALADATGGRELRWRGGPLRPVVEQLLNEVRSGYVLYFRPAPAAARGWREIGVRVLGVKDAKVRARAGYWH